MDPRFSQFSKKARRTLLLVFLLFLGVNIYATLGFVIVEGQSFLDAYYMAVITITTVGFQEVFPLSDAGRVFAISCIYMGLLATGFSVALISNLFFEGTLLEFFKGRTQEFRMKKLKNHYIICGYGTTGKSIARELLTQGEQVLVIDQHQHDNEENGPFFYQGDARKDEVLVKAGIDRADGLATTLTEDADNVFVVLSARALNPELKIVSRYKEGESRTKLQIAGVDHAVSPYRMGGHRLAMALTNPPFLEVLDASFQKTPLAVRFHHIKIKATDKLIGKTLAGAGIREHADGALVVAILNSEGDTVFNPPPHFLMDEAEQLLVLCDERQAEQLRGYLN